MSRLRKLYDALLAEVEQDPEVSIVDTTQINEDAGVVTLGIWFPEAEEMVTCKIWSNEEKARTSTWVVPGNRASGPMEIPISLAEKYELGCPGAPGMVGESELHQFPSAEDMAEVLFLLLRNELEILHDSRNSTRN